LNAPRTSKLVSLREAIAEHVGDGDCVVIEGFTHLIGFASGHEIIRQRKRDLVLARLTPDLVYDQMIAAGCARKLIFSWAGNPGAGSLYAIRRAIEEGVPRALEIEEYSHFGMVARFTAGASNLPFAAVKTFTGSDLPNVNPLIRSVVCPYTGETLPTVPALRPDVAILHVQRAAVDGTAQVWGLLGVQKEAAFASRRVVVVAEEIVDQSVVRADPNRTLVPGFVVDAVVHEPWGCHPSYAQGYYDRDNESYLAWGEISKDRTRLERWLDEWVHGVANRAEYVAKLGPDLDRLRATPRPSGTVDFGY
jgi:glutaconate CoA-transferase subunit A